MRQRYQTLTFLYRKTESGYLYCVFHRQDDPMWQALSGGGEDNETPIETVKREIFEEAGISDDLKIIQLDSVSSIPVEFIRGFIWGNDVLVVPEYTFGAEVKNGDIKLSDEHSEFGWFSYEEALEKLKFDSNKNALWELNHRLTHGMIKP